MIKKLKIEMKKDKKDKKIKTLIKIHNSEINLNLSFSYIQADQT